MNNTKLQSLFISPDNSIRAAMECIDGGSCGIALVVDRERCLLGAITDGDVRRAILAGKDLESPVQVILASKISTQYRKPVTASPETNHKSLIALMNEHVIRQIPILDNAGKVVDLVMMDDFVPTQDLPLQAVIMAGGLGTRLRPLTENLPKPMLQVGGKPLMEHIIEKLKQVGIRRIHIATHYKPEKIEEYFGDGKTFGVELRYLSEDQPLGTGGSLGSINAPTEPMLVINGDIFTQVDFKAMHDFHQENRADMTVAVRQYGMQVPYGVIECDGPRVFSLSEKPQIQLFINAGIYIIDPVVYQYIPSSDHFNMTDLIQWLLNAGRNVISFPIFEYWLDIGQPADYEQAQAFRK